ncbi:hypothetical protein PROFUN_13953 [Planoprotostelium fungivorum]|uniref:Uncharacterized protein n=1 Tax=Planoprotostelium fungivorum TaxID=1890364 RepID=A0A2P6N2I1_9EUKA|nr:hypothetical protein PROFUN_13936 [Planoprotostelium fungivorum]PRP78151.1 hypothetical protein PROFUN_13953 [Planoprotostelium fungivorum]
MFGDTTTASYWRRKIPGPIYVLSIAVRLNSTWGLSSSRVLRVFRRPSIENLEFGTTLRLYGGIACHPGGSNDPGPGTLSLIFFWQIAVLGRSDTMVGVVERLLCGGTSELILRTVLLEPHFFHNHTR